MIKKVLALVLFFSIVSISAMILLMVFFPLIKPIFLVIISILTSLSLTCTLIMASKKPFSIEREYKIGKIMLVVSCLFLNFVALVCILGGIIWLITEKSKDFALFGASGVIIFLGLICLLFGIMIARAIAIDYKNINAYRAKKKLD